MVPPGRNEVIVDGQIEHRDRDRGKSLKGAVLDCLLLFRGAANSQQTSLPTLHQLGEQACRILEWLQWKLLVRSNDDNLVKLR